MENQIRNALHNYNKLTLWHIFKKARLFSGVDERFDALKGTLLQIWKSPYMF